MDKQELKEVSAVHEKLHMIYYGTDEMYHAQLNAKITIDGTVYVHQQLEDGTSDWVEVKVPVFKNRVETSAPDPLTSASDKEN